MRGQWTFNGFTVGSSRRCEILVSSSGQNPFVTSGLPGFWGNSVTPPGLKPEIRPKPISPRPSTPTKQTYPGQFMGVLSSATVWRHDACSSLTPHGVFTSSTQCAAVSTQPGATSVPPQNWPSLSFFRLTCHLWTFWFYQYGGMGLPGVVSIFFPSKRGPTMSTTFLSHGRMLVHLVLC